MAATAVLFAMNGEKVLHPFFARTNGDSHSEASSSTNEPPNTLNEGQLDGADESAAQPKKIGRPRKSKTTLGNPGKIQKTLQEIVKAKTTAPIEQRTQEIPNSLSSDPIISPHRNKRRRISETEPVDVGDDDIQPDVQDLSSDELPDRQCSPRVEDPASSPMSVKTRETVEEEPTTPPKKMLRLNANGKFSSPISKSVNQNETTIEGPRKRGRPRKPKEVVEAKGLLVKLQYNIEGNIGHTIDRILSGSERHSPKDPSVTPKKQRAPRKRIPPKPTHPFFLGKPKEDPAPKHDSPRKTSAITPGKLRTQTMTDRSPKFAATRPVPEYSVGSGLLKDRLMFKHAGAKEPAWPSKEQSHVRGLDNSDLQESLHNPIPDLRDDRRKRKNASIPFPATQSLIRQFGDQLKPEVQAELRPDGFHEPHPSLSRPKRLLVSGEEIASCIVSQLSTSLDDDAEDELAQPSTSHITAHPALRKLYGKIPSSLSAFDESKGEASGWMHKYAPSTADEVLQPNRETAVLKQWLTSLTITAVESISHVESRASTVVEPKPKRKKRRRKNDDMDDFLVDSDEDVHDMDELTDPEDLDALSSSARQSMKSIVQVAGEGVKLSNAILLSGPHGCGKTAAAHAVAKELGFKVFEISPSERRSGKDVLDKVGNMTENHLVKHHGTEDVAVLSSAEEPNRHEEAFQRDLASGRQGKMNAFFKPRSTTKQSSPKKQRITKTKVDTVELVKKAVKKPPKDQQQSLILLEEVDILFKDDKEFWTTIFKLIATSKRPFIMTCNDEDLVPLQAMSLHAILRFSPPPVDLAADYLLLIGATEGHLLKRDAALSIYQSKKCDLRAAIAELDLWCQMAVADPRGGLSWIYQRYPPGSDLDAQGRKLRVVSEDTYKAGMGLCPDNTLDDHTQMLWTKRQFGVDVTDVLEWHELAYMHSQELPSLKQYSRFADSLSATDVYCHTARSFLDTTQRPMGDKARSHYIEGIQLLQTDEQVDYIGLTTELSIASTLSAYRVADLVAPGDVAAKLKASNIQNNWSASMSSVLNRRDFACFDAISVPSETTLFLGPGLVQSSFDGPLGPIATDLAPYVRSIVQHERALNEQREMLANLDGEVRNAKKARTTRAARSAVEGGQRASTRREKWFTKTLDMDAVLATGGRDWPRLASEAVTFASRDCSEAPASSTESTGQI